MLEVARAPYDRIEHANRKRQETQERKRAQLREDPTTARKALARFRDSHVGYLDELGADGRRAAEILIGSTDTPAEQERAALDALVAELENVLVQPGGWAPSPGSTVRRSVNALVPFYRERQQQLIDQLAARYGESPSIRRARKTLQDEKLLDRRSAERLPEEASSDAKARDEQERRRLAYLEWREQAAQSLLRKSDPMARLTRSREDFYAQIDQEKLRECKRCKQTIYPQLDREQTASAGRSAGCPFCPGIWRSAHRAPSHLYGGVAMSDSFRQPRRGAGCPTAGRRRAGSSRRDERSRPRQLRDVCPRRARLPDHDHEAFADWFVAYWRQRGAELFSDQTVTEEADVEA